MHITNAHVWMVLYINTGPNLCHLATPSELAVHQHNASGDRHQLAFGSQMVRLEDELDVSLQEHLPSVFQSPMFKPSAVEQACWQLVWSVGGVAPFLLNSAQVGFVSSESPRPASIETAMTR